MSNAANFSYPTCICRPQWGDPLEFCQYLWRQKTRVPCLSCGVVSVIYLDVSRERWLATDWQTDRSKVIAYTALAQRRAVIKLTYIWTAKNIKYINIFASVSYKAANHQRGTRRWHSYFRATWRRSTTTGLRVTWPCVTSYCTGREWVAAMTNCGWWKPTTVRTLYGMSVIHPSSVYRR